MLHDRWLETVHRHRDATALVDLAAGRSWTFSQLAAEAGRPATTTPPAAPGAAAFPSGSGAGFILDVLRAWRDGLPVCPLEPGQAPPAFPPPPAGIVHLKITSATTGPPRLVAFTSAQLAADADNLVPTMGLHPDQPNLGAISLAHSYGFSNLVTPLLLHGIPLLLPGSALPEAVRRAAATAAFPALTLPAVPALWRAWHDADAIPANIRLAISAGAPLPLALEREVFERRGLKIHNFYGSSECGGIAYDDSSTPRTDAALAGSAVRNVGLDVADDGCLVVSGAAVGTTYWPEGSPALAAGRFHTADLAECRDGLVWLRGRAGEIINVAGRKIAPGVIEQVLLAHPAVRECAVVGLPSPGASRGEVIAAVVVPRSTVTVESLRTFLASRLPAWQVPREWVLRDEPLSDGRGKVPRERLREWVRAVGGSQ